MINWQEHEEMMAEENARYDYQRELMEEMADPCDNPDYYDGDPAYAPEADYNGPQVQINQVSDDTIPF